MGFWTQEQAKEAALCSLFGLNSTVDPGGCEKRDADEMSGLARTLGHLRTPKKLSRMSAFPWFRPGKRGKTAMNWMVSKSRFCWVFLLFGTCFILYICWPYLRLLAPTLNTPLNTPWATLQTGILLCIHLCHLPPDPRIWLPKALEVFFSFQTWFSSTSCKSPVFVQAFSLELSTSPYCRGIWPKGSCPLLFVLLAGISTAQAISAILTHQSVLMYRILGVFSNTHSNKCE